MFVSGKNGVMVELSESYSGVIEIHNKILTMVGRAERFLVERLFDTHLQNLLL